MEQIGQLIEETMESYYEYVSKVEDGCQIIANLIKEDDVPAAMRAIVDLSEGLFWLSKVEQQLLNQSYKITSNVQYASSLYRGINAALEVKNYQVVALQFEKELKPLFVDAKSWAFEKVIQ